MKIVYIILLAVLCTSCASPSPKVIRPVRIESQREYIKPNKINKQDNSYSEKKNEIVTEVETEMSEIKTSPEILLLTIIFLQSIVIFSLAILTWYQRKKINKQTQNIFR